MNELRAAIAKKLCEIRAETEKRRALEIELCKSAAIIMREIEPLGEVALRFKVVAAPSIPLVELQRVDRGTALKVTADNKVWKIPIDYHPNKPSIYTDDLDYRALRYMLDAIINGNE